MQNKTKTPKHCYIYEQENMLKAIQAVKDNIMSTRCAAKTFSVPRTSLQRRIEGKYDVNSHSGRKPIMSYLDEKKLIDYSCNRASMGIGFGKKQFLKYATILGKKKNVSFKQGLPSDKWWRLLKKRHDNFRQRKPEGTASIRHERMEKEFVSRYFDALKEQLETFNLHDKPDQVWNMDESGVQLDHVPHKVIARKGTKYLHSRTSGKRETITIIAAVNANGKCIPPHIIVKGKTQAMLYGFDVESAPIGTNMSVSDSGWTKQGLAQLWFKNTFLPSIGPHRPQILILDGHDSHNFLELIEMAREENIILFELPPHTSHWLQPLDRTVFSPFKNYYNEACQNLMNEYPGVLVSHSNFCGLFTKAWEKAMSPANIISGFRACGILPFNPNAIPNEAYLTNIPHQTEKYIPVIEVIGIEQDNMTSALSNDTEATQTQVITDLNTSNEGGQVELLISEKICSTKSNILPFKENTINVNNNITSDNSLMPKQHEASLALHALEMSVSPNTLATYKRMYKEGRTRVNDHIYITWKRYKDMTVTSTITNNKILPKHSSEQENLEPIEIINTRLISNISPHQEQSNNSNVNHILESPKTSNIYPQTTKTNIPVASFYGKHKNNTNYSSHIEDEDKDILPYPTTTKTSKKNYRSGNYFVLTSNEVFEAKQRSQKEKQDKLAQKEERTRLRELKKLERAEIEKTKQLKRQECLKNKKIKKKKTG